MFPWSMINMLDLVNIMNPYGIPIVAKRQVGNCVFSGMDIPILMRWWIYVNYIELSWATRLFIQQLFN